MDESAALDAYLFQRHLRPLVEPPPLPDRPDPGRPLTIPALDGTPVAATTWKGSSGRDARRGVVIASATGVKRGFYAPFAGWLAWRGFDVVTFDYRGIGDSRSRSRSGPAPTMHDWGEHDLAGVLAWAFERFGQTALIGHSVGGQLVGLLPEPERLRALVTVGAQSGDYRLWPMPLRLGIAALWYGLMPGVTHAVGYFPGALGIGEDLPAGVALEWARWGRTPGYLVGGDGEGSAARRDAFARVRAPMLAIGIDDDPYAPRAAVDALVSLFTNAKVDRRHVLRPRVGHFGLFRRANANLWEDVAGFLEDHLR